jgi:restriction system protein
MLVISPKDFEVAVARLFSSMGFVARETRYTADGGWDVDVYDGSKRYIVECKRYGLDKPVGRPILQKLHSAMITEKASGAMCVTTSHFTVPALEFARDNGIQVFDGTALGNLLCKAFGESGDNIVFGLCRVCAQTASFVPEVGNDNVFSTCPNGHMVKHPFIVDVHPRVSYRMRDLKKAGVWTAG